MNRYIQHAYLYLKNTDLIGKNRLTRLQYLRNISILILFMLIVLSTIFFLPSALFEVLFIFVLPVPILLLGSTIGRLHDLGYSGWWSFLGFAPVVGILFILYPLTAKGNALPNRHGKRVNTAHTKIDYVFAYLNIVLIPLLIVVGIWGGLIATL